MKIISKKISMLFFVFALTISFIGTVFASASVAIETVITDKVTDGTADNPIDVFHKDTPMIYITWKSDQLKEGQTIKAVWIADDTNNVAPPHYKIDEASFNINPKSAEEKVLSHLPGGYWSGTFSMNKPNTGWPIGKYHVDIYVDKDLVKTVNFTVAEKPQEKQSTANDNKAAETNWGAIAIDTASETKDPYYGYGGGDSKDEAEQIAKKYCADAGGTQCKVMVNYQECGAYASSDNSTGKGIGSTKKAAEENALKECGSHDCAIIISDCNK